MKRRIVLLTIIGLFLLMLPLIAEAEIIDSGKCGENITWTLDNQGVLTINGTGQMDQYGYQFYAPWYSIRHLVQSVSIDNGVTSIGDYSFYSCFRLTSVDIPDSVTCIGESAFQQCSNLASIIIPNSVREIGNAAFYYCSSLSGLDIPDGVNTIPYALCSGCNNLVNVSIPDSVTSIVNNNFMQCNNLKSITIPGSVTTLGGDSFGENENLESIIFLHTPSDRFIDEGSWIPTTTTIYCYEYTDVESCYRNNGYSVVLLDELDINTIRFINIENDFRIKNGDTYKLNYCISPSHDDPTIKWSSTNSNIISVSSDGTVSAKSIGTAIITATAGSVSDSVKISSYIPPKSFNINYTEAWIVAKETLQLSATDIKPVNAEPLIFWSSSDPSQATVNASGLVSSQKPGDVTITAYGENGLYRECILHICYPVSAIEFEDKNVTIFPYTNYQMIANVTMRTQSCINHLITFTSSNPEVATVDEDGLVHGITAGTTTIIATAASGVKASMKIAVQDAFVLLLPKRLTEIDAEAFKGTACEVVIIPEGCTTIGENAFAKCMNLVYVRIPASVTNYPASAFEDFNANLVIDWEGH